MAKRFSAALLVPTFLALLFLPSVTAQPSRTSPEVAGGAFAGGLAILIFACAGLILAVGLALFVFWVLMIVDCFQRENDEFPNATENTKTVWIVILLVSWLAGLYWLAAVLYYVLVKKKMPQRKM